jgi:hypothetical protein
MLAGTEDYYSPFTVPAYARPQHGIFVNTALNLSSHGALHPSIREAYMLRLVLLIVLILLILGSLPLWPYSAGFGYGPSGGLGLVLLIVLILILVGRI